MPATAAAKTSHIHESRGRNTGAQSGAGMRRDEYWPEYDGSLALKRGQDIAFDLSHFDRRTAVRRAVAVEAMPVREKVQRKAAAKRASSARVSLFTFASFVMAMGLLLMIVYSYVQLSELSESAAGLEKQLQTLKNEEAVMISDYEERVSLKEVEDIAVNRLGMVKPEQDQVKYLDLSGGDHSVVLPKSHGGQSVFLTGIVHALGGLVNFIN